MITIVMPSLGERADHRHDFADLAVPEPGQGLVEQQEARLTGERARQLHQAQLPGGEARGLAVGDLREPDARDRAVGQRPGVRPRRGRARRRRP